MQKISEHQIRASLIDASLRERKSLSLPKHFGELDWENLDVNLPNDVTFFNARQAGPAGRNGDTISTLVCEKFECSINVRTPQP